MKRKLQLSSLKNTYRRTILLIGALLGFSSAIVAQYGAPMAHYKISGTVRSKDCQTPIPKIKVRYAESSEPKYYSYPAFTDSSGHFELNIYEEYWSNNENKQINIIAEDEDGNDNNGNFLALEKQFILNKLKKEFYYNEVYDNIDMDMEMYYNGKSPCKTGPSEDTTIRDSSFIQKLCILTDSIIKKESINNNVTEILSQDKDSISGDKREPSSDNNDLPIIFPNPSNGFYTVKMYLSNETQLSLFVFDCSSKLIYSESLMCCKGVNEKQVSIETAAGGTYYLLIKAGNKIYSGRLIKE